VRKLLAVLLLMAASAAWAAPMLNLITLTGPGSLTDTALRKVAPAIERETGMAVVIQNLPGAGGILGARAALEAPADGATVLMGNSSLVHMALTQPAMGFDPVAAFAPLQGLVRGEFGVFVPAASAVRAPADLRAGGQTFVGVASPMGSMSAILLDRTLGLQSVEVGYKQFGQAVADLAGGRLSHMTGPVDASALRAMLDAGRIRQVGTLAELGVADFSWSGFFVRADTPTQTQRSLAEALRRAVSTTPLDGRLDVSGQELRRIQLGEAPTMRAALKLQ